MNKVYRIVSLDKFKRFDQLDDYERQKLGKNSTDIEVYYLIPIKTIRPMTKKEQIEYRRRKMQERINE